MSKSPIARRADLKEAHKRFRKKGETISLEDCARLWGVSKARFINVRNDIADFPDPVAKHGNAYVYEARPVIEAMLRHETRNDALVASKASKVAAILGGRTDDLDDVLPASEMLALARTRAEVEKRMRDQGQLVLAAEVQEVAADVFGEISNTLGKLSDSVDPNGRLPGPTRTLLDGLGKDLLLRMYARLNDMLGGDAVPDVRRTAPAARRTDRPRRSKVPRKRA